MFCKLIQGTTEVLGICRDIRSYDDDDDHDDDDGDQILSKFRNFYIMLDYISYVNTCY